MTELQKLEMTPKNAGFTVSNKKTNKNTSSHHCYCLHKCVYTSHGVNLYQIFVLLHAYFIITSILHTAVVPHYT